MHVLFIISIHKNIIFCNIEINSIYITYLSVVWAEVINAAHKRMRCKACIHNLCIRIVSDTV